MLQPKSLRQRLSIYLILPVALLLFLMGIAGFIYARDLLLSEWREASVLKLQRAAHQVDMRIARVKEWIGIFHQKSGSQETDELHYLAIEQLKKQEGVDQVQLIWSNHQTLLTVPKGARMSRMMRQMDGDRRMMMRRFHSARIREITPPRFDETINHETVSLISDLNDENGQPVGRLEVWLDFNMLIQDVRESGWWQSNKAFLVSDSGKILTGTAHDMRGSLADSGDPLERETVKAMKTSSYGTILGAGHPPNEVVGFYKLQEAQWSLVMIAPGKEILAPIVRFRLYYFAIGTGFIFLIVVLIRIVTGRTVVAINEVSQAAKRVAEGNYGELLPVKTQDEVGELIRSFNSMVSQLKERLQLKEELNLAMEVQQNLLPKQTPRFEGLDIAGKSVYCDETGGDFYDFIDVCCEKSQQLGIAVGDVAGHGISTALMMATVRAFLRSRVTHPGSISEVVTDVNRLVVNDTEETGQFMTLFYLTLNPAEKSLSWVRAGHDPAFIYDPKQGKIAELNGNGAALGISEDAQYQQNSINGLDKGQVLLIGTDGLWETQNTSGEMFGKERLKALISKHADRSAEEIITLAIDSLAAFRNSARQEDDITLVVVKAES